MLRFYRICCLAVLLVVSHPALAEVPAPVEWSIGLQGDVLNIDAKTKAPQPPAQRLNASPSFLELSFPKTKMAGASQTKSLDRGLVQKVQTSQDGDSAVVRVFVVNKPKVTLTKTATGYRYSIRMSEPAGAPAAAKAPTQPKAPAATPPVATKPPVATPPVATKPPVATPPVATKPPVSTPPATTKPPVATPPVATKPPVATPPVASTPPVATPPVATRPPISTPTGRDPKTLISVVFVDKPLNAAITELATKAGYTAQLDPSLSGSVNLSLSDVPFDDALKMLLEPFGDSVNADIGYTTVTVAKVAAASTPSTASTLSAGPMVSEYYPFSTKDAQKMMDAAKKAIPDLSYRVDPVLNILLVQGPREEVVRLGELLKSMSNK